VYATVHWSLADLHESPLTGSRDRPRHRPGPGRMHRRLGSARDRCHAPPCDAPQGFWMDRVNGNDREHMTRAWNRSVGRPPTQKAWPRVLWLVLLTAAALAPGACRRTTAEGAGDAGLVGQYPAHKTLRAFSSQRELESFLTKLAKQRRAHQASLPAPPSEDTAEEISGAEPAAKQNDPATITCIAALRQSCI
jgi:hypothetical protein